MNTCSRMLEMLTSQGLPCVEREGTVFVREQYRITPMAPILDDHVVSRRLADELLRLLGGWFVQWTRPAADEAESRGWYAVICRRFVEVEQVESANVRSKLRRGLKRCRVQRVPLDQFLTHAHGIHEAALRGYGAAEAASFDRASFEAQLERERGFDDLRHYWLVFVDERPVAYAKTILYGRTEVDYTSLKFDPQFLKHYSS